jgi:hypothetical protein
MRINLFRTTVIKKQTGQIFEADMREGKISNVEVLWGRKRWIEIVRGLIFRVDERSQSSEVIEGRQFRTEENKKLRNSEKNGELKEINGTRGQRGSRES